MVYRKTKKLSHKHRKAVHKKRRSMRMRGGGSMGPMQPALVPVFNGPPNNPASITNMPTGNYLSLSGAGIPSGLPVSPAPSNPQFGGYSQALSKGRGGKRKSNSKKSKKSKKSKGRRSVKKIKYGGYGYGNRVRRHRRSRHMSGGGFFDTFFPQDAVNVVRSIPAGVQQLSDKFNGVGSSADTKVYPTDQPLVKMPQSAPAFVPPNINQMYSRASSTV